MAAAAEVGGTAVGDDLVLGVERLHLEGIVGDEARLCTREAHLALLLQLVAAHRGVPDAYLVDGGVQRAVVGIENLRILHILQRAACANEQLVATQ